MAVRGENNNNNNKNNNTISRASANIQGPFFSLKDNSAELHHFLQSGENWKVLQNFLF